jgi:hypothetical protein
MSRKSRFRRIEARFVDAETPGPPPHASDDQTPNGLRNFWPRSRKGDSENERATQARPAASMRGVSTSR